MLATVLIAFLLLLFARMLISYLVLLGRYQATGYVAVAFEVVFTVTDVPLRPLERVLPPVRVGRVAFSLAYPVLFLAVSIVLSQVNAL